MSGRDFGDAIPTSTREMHSGAAPTLVDNDVVTMPMLTPAGAHSHYTDTATYRIYGEDKPCRILATHVDDSHPGDVAHPRGEPRYSQTYVLTCPVDTSEMGCTKWHPLVHVMGVA